jgi:hypothetical protein
VFYLLRSREKLTLPEANKFIVLYRLEGKMLSHMKGESARTMNEDFSQINQLGAMSTRSQLVIVVK